MSVSAIIFTMKQWGLVIDQEGAMKMGIDQTAFNQISTSLARHFDSLYYVDIETGEFTVFVPPRMLTGLDIPPMGLDFFALARENAHTFVHPEDLMHAIKIHDRKEILKYLSVNDSYSTRLRLVIDGRIIHTRQLYTLCDDRQHVVCCMENIEEESQEREEAKKTLRSVGRLAKMDELTGVKNRQAFEEFSEDTDGKILLGRHDTEFAVVMCDINDLKLINDSKGQNLGDEAILQACRMVCNTFKHSPVFRTGGDEFVAVLSDNDYKIRDQLLEELREESRVNGLMHSGPVVACGMAVYDPDRDGGISSVYEKAEAQMVENKAATKAKKSPFSLKSSVSSSAGEKPNIETIPSDRKKKLDGLFASFFTVSQGGYLYLNDLRYDYSRLSLAMVDDFGLRSEYIYHVGKLIQERMHPDDLEFYNEAVNAAIMSGTASKPISFRLHDTSGSYIPLTTRSFILCDSNGNPEYFGGKLIPQ